jgi:hypothetical protein
VFLDLITPIFSGGAGGCKPVPDYNPEPDYVPDQPDIYVANHYSSPAPTATLRTRLLSAGLSARRTATGTMGKKVIK